MSVEDVISERETGFLLLEQSALCDINSLMHSLFVAFGYYVYYLEYHPKS